MERLLKAIHGGDLIDPIRFVRISEVKAQASENPEQDSNGIDQEKNSEHNSCDIVFLFIKPNLWIR